MLQVETWTDLPRHQAQNHAWSDADSCASTDATAENTGMLRVSLGGTTFAALEQTTTDRFYKLPGNYLFIQFIDTSPSSILIPLSPCEMSPAHPSCL